MRSFGLWYKDNKKTSDEPVFSVHMNFWSESVKKGENFPDLDIGIKVTNFGNVNKLIFECPFVISESEVKDLSHKLYNKNTANLIFNTDGEIETRDSYSVYTFTKNDVTEKLLIFPLEQNVGEIFSLVAEDQKTDMIIDFSKFNAYLKEKQRFDDINEVYIRFRITTNSFHHNIYFDCEPTNKSFESAFSGTRIYDFKINEKRNIDDKTITRKTGVEKYKWASIDVVHLLIMEPSSYDIESFANPQITCRELEGNLWDDYYGNSIDYSKGRILAYHWKSDKDYSCLIKVRYSKTDFSTLCAYVLIVIALGIVGSTIVSVAQAIFEKASVSFALISVALAVILFLSGLYLGKKK